jgi:hypothetical protein
MSWCVCCLSPLSPLRHPGYQRTRSVDRPLKLALEKLAVRRDATSALRDSMITFDDLILAKK